MTDEDLMMPDGSRRESGVAQSHLFGQTDNYSLTGQTVEAVVVQCRFPGVPGNVTGCLEYDCDPITPNISRLFNVLDVTGYQGLYDGEQIVLRAATPQGVNGAPWLPTFTTRTLSNGDRVLITFADGAVTRPFIIGFLPNPQSTVFPPVPANPAHVRTKTIAHRGTVVQLDGQGNLNVTFGVNQDTAEPTTPNKKMTLTIGTCTITLDNSTGSTDVKIQNGAADIEIDANGNVNVVPASPGIVKLNGGVINPTTPAANQGVARAKDIAGATAGPYPVLVNGVPSGTTVSTTVASGD